MIESITKWENVTQAIGQNPEYESYIHTCAVMWPDQMVIET